MQRLNKELDELKSKDLYRKRLVVEPSNDFPYVQIEGKRVLSFASNNYFGLGSTTPSGEPFVQMSSPLVTGYTTSHQTLEERLASLKGLPAGLLFSSGFTANSALLSTLIGPKDAVLLDKYCHASLMEITRNSNAHFHSFPHKRYDLARKKLAKLRPLYEVVYLVSDTLFSMEGDEADLAELSNLAKTFNVVLILDDAHAMGCCGQNGEGLATLASLGLNPNQLIVTGTLSKALGSYGGFVCASETVVEYLINKARPYIYNTALPLVHVEAALQHLAGIPKPQEKLLANIAYFTELLHIKNHPPYSPIIKIPVGDNDKALQLSGVLLHQGLHVPAIRYPTVPRKDAMLRVSLSASHTFEQLRALSQALAHGTMTP